MQTVLNANNAVNTYQRREIKGYTELEELSLNLIWSWTHGSDKLWKTLDPVLWDLTHNPRVVLQSVSTERLKNTLADPNFIKMVEEHLKANRDMLEAPAWFQKTHPKSPLSCVAYFSMEFMLSEALPIYSGGLGNVAGDQLKAASDLGVPVVGVGLLYQQGYFRQLIDKSGDQQALYPYNDPGQLPIMPLRKSNGEWVRLEVPMPGWSLWFRAWQVKVGKVQLYLLDTNDPANFPAHRGIISELYGGGSELRLKQELLLGIGGWWLLEELGIKPEICHLNEGHAAFAVLARALSVMKETGQPFEAALAATRAGNHFTTHTAVPAGFDRFSPALIEQYLGNYIQNKLKISIKDCLALGRLNRNDSSEPFNMAYLAIRGSGTINGVSKLHSKVSRKIFEPLFPRYPEEEIPIGYVTNGVHTPSWDSRSADDVWTKACGQKRWLGPTEKLGEAICKVSDIELWNMRNENRKILIEFACSRLSRLLDLRGASPEEIEKAKHLFDPNTLTIGFARRFATYKRPNMLLKDPERLLRILNNPKYPVQLILAGKAHPADKPGQAMIKDWMSFISRPEARSRVIFLSDYDMNMTEQMVAGMDVWLNTPRRPWEACGTSGMKVLVNGGLNLSELDGWWAEAYTPKVGWALGDGLEHGDNPAVDDAEANALYELLEHQVIPEFYDRDANGIPVSWVAKMRNSMSQLTPQFSANRAVREYTEKYYIPSAVAYRARMENKAAFGQKFVKWQHLIERAWTTLRFGGVKVETKGDQYAFEVPLYLDDLDPNSVKVELYRVGVNGGQPLVYEMKRERQLPGAANMYLYQASVPANCPAEHYTARVTPFFAGVVGPLESPYILWQR